MARKPNDQLKQNLLLVFVAVCVVLVGLTWADNLSEPQEETSVQLRGAPPTVESGRVPSVVVPTKEHKNEHASTPEAGSTLEAASTIEATPELTPTAPFYFNPTDDE